MDFHQTWHVHSYFGDLGPVIQSIVSLTSSLVVKMLTVIVCTISNSYVLLLKKNVSSLNAKATHIFQQKY